MTIAFRITPRGRYALSASASFLCGFTPATGSACSSGAGMTFGFALDRTFEPVAVSLRQDGAMIVGEAVGRADAGAVAAQVARVLSLDHDGAGWDEVGRRDAVIGALQERYDAMRPVCFYSPYEAACWGILAARTPMRLAARVRAGLSDALGAKLAIGDTTVAVFPTPVALLDADVLPGVPKEKARRLRGIAEAALDGALDVDLLRGLHPAEARAHLRKLDGVGEWTAEHVMVRGAGLADEPAFVEPRVRAGFRLAYGLSDEPDDAALRAVGERWRPFRTWASVLLALHLSRSGLWNAPTATDRRPVTRRATAPAARGAAPAPSAALRLR